MVKIMVSINPKHDYYDVEVFIYTQIGRLDKSEKYSDVKQIVIRNAEVRISRQLSPSPIVMILECEKPSVELRENSLLYILGRGCDCEDNNRSI